MLDQFRGRLQSDLDAETLWPVTNQIDYISAISELKAFKGVYHSLVFCLGEEENYLD